jgi:hypothetical protein
MTKEYVRFQWLRLPRLLRAFLVALTSVVIGMGGLGIIAVTLAVIIDVLGRVFGGLGAVVIIIAAVLVVLLTHTAYGETEPAIKRKAKDE